MKSFAGWTADSKMAARYIHLTGRGHVTAVLERAGVDVENGKNVIESKPMLELSRCPNCDRQIDQDMLTCPYCQFILDDKVGISQGDRVTELEATVEGLKSLLLDVLNNPEALAETKRRLIQE